MDRDPYSEYNDYIKKRRDGLSERKVENMIKEEIAKNKPKIGWLKALTIFLLIYSLVMSYFVAKNMTGITETINKNGQVESSTISIKNNSVSTENAVAKKSLDSVVGITTVGVQENMFFQGRVVEGVGSGVVVSKDGYILTNINSGNSGGGLFDQEGKLIGINTAKASAEGIGFTIPINVAKTIVDNIVSGGSFEGVKLGISGVDVKTFQQATGQKLSIDKGIYVVEVVRESSAQKAGVTRGDIITKVNGKEINTMSSLKKALLEVRPQQKGKITVYRDGNTKDLDIEFSTLQQK